MNKTSQEARQIAEFFKPPFIYDEGSQYILDNDGQTILELRGWGNISSKVKDEDKSAKIQDTIGHEVAEALTAYLTRFDAPTAAPVDGDKIWDDCVRTVLAVKDFATEKHVTEALIYMKDLYFAPSNGNSSPAPQNAAGDNWISVDKEKPSDFRIRFKDKYMNEFYGNYSKVVDNYYAYGINEPILNVVAWQPLPSPPTATAEQIEL